jgi:hypothetical protein
MCRYFPPLAALCRRTGQHCVDERQQHARALYVRTLVHSVLPDADTKHHIGARVNEHLLVDGRLCKTRKFHLKKSANTWLP